MTSKTTALVMSALGLALCVSVNPGHAQSRHGDSELTAAPHVGKAVGVPQVEMAGGGYGLGSHNDAFSRKVAGTYLDTGEVAGGPFTGMQTLSADGTQTATNNNCCGFAGGLYDNLQGPAHGAWKRTGPDQVTVNSVIQIFMLDGTPFITARVTVVVDFLDSDYNTADAIIQTELFFWAVPGELPGPDVQNDAPALTLCGTDSWTRLQVVEPQACP